MSPMNLMPPGESPNNLWPPDATPGPLGPNADTPSNFTGSSPKSSKPTADAPIKFTPGDKKVFCSHDPRLSFGVVMLIVSCSFIQTSASGRNCLNENDIIEIVTSYVL